MLQMAWSAGYTLSESRNTALNRKVRHIQYLQLKRALLRERVAPSASSLSS